MSINVKYSKVFKGLGIRYIELRLARKMVQEDVIKYDFSVRHYQQLEAGRPHSLVTLFRIAEMYKNDADKILKGLV